MRGPEGDDGPLSTLPEVSSQGAIVPPGSHCKEPGLRCRPWGIEHTYARDLPCLPFRRNHSASELSKERSATSCFAASRLFTPVQGDARQRRRSSTPVVPRSGQNCRREGPYEATTPDASRLGHDGPHRVALVRPDDIARSNGQIAPERTPPGGLRALRQPLRPLCGVVVSGYGRAIEGVSALPTMHVPPSGLSGAALLEPSAAGIPAAGLSASVSLLPVSPHDCGHPFGA